jgi:hypothetical protein
MSTLMRASHQWASRPADERFISLLELQDHVTRQRETSRSTVISSRKIEVHPDPEDPQLRGLLVEAGCSAMVPTHWSFGQLCSRAASPSPSAYFRENRVPAPLIADCLNYNLRFTRDIEEVGILATGDELRAVNGARYGRIWNAEIVDTLVDKFGDGVSGHWRVPGEFGRRVNVDRQNTTLFASDRDMFVFLADEDRRIEVAGRNLARGFFLWNSEVGDKTLGVGFFLFDYVCSNRIVWGADQYTEVRIRHTSGAPDRWLEETIPVLTEYSEGSTKPVQQAIEDARVRKIRDDLDTFLATRFGKSLVPAIKAIHEVEEGRPIESVWDVAVAATAHARSVPNTDKRLEIERTAGALLTAA